MQRAQPDDGTRHASICPDPMTRMPSEEDATRGLLHAPQRGFRRYALAMKRNVSLAHSFGRTAAM
jgi:hypothetical protein